MIPLGHPSAVLAADLQNLVARTLPIWAFLRGARIFVTGGTGFYGCWLLESFAAANQIADLGAELIVLTRNPDRFANARPHLASSPGIKLTQGDVRDFNFPTGDFTHVIHAASELSLPNPHDPAGTIESTLQGCRRVLSFASQKGVKELLYTSSGAVYGPQPPGIRFLAEDQSVKLLPLNPRSSYGMAKQMGELLCVMEGERAGIKVKIARGFAFVGPYLPNAPHLAAASFLRSALANEKIVIQGHGQTLRSYLYGADLAEWLWTILVSGSHARPYNLGSDVEISILGLAKTIVGAYGSELEIEVRQELPTGAPPDSYLPDISRARKELHLDVHTPIEESIRRTILHHLETK